mmetsp:Transcript_30980/g.37812  ORF Transcript_30980/g.37812 Transcript_30980/m.37812 type:complete len:81 (+) Transcript_30980:214-456(+)
MRDYHMIRASKVFVFGTSYCPGGRIGVAGDVILRPGLNFEEVEGCAVMYTIRISSSMNQTTSQRLYPKLRATIPSFTTAA